jgi:Na+/serine symporter
MIDLVYWSFLAVLLPIALYVCVSILSLVYWSFRAATWPIVLHVCVKILRLPRGRSSGAAIDRSGAAIDRSC